MHTFTLKTHGEIFAEAQALTATPTLGNKNAKPEAGAHMGGLAVSLLAKGAVSVAAGGHVTVAVETAPTTEDADFKPLISYNSAGTGAFPAGFTAQDGRKLVCLPLPEAARHVRVKLSGSGVTGTVDCILEYLAR